MSDKVFPSLRNSIRRLLLAEYGRSPTSLPDRANCNHPVRAIADCEEICGNLIDQRVHWKGSADVSALAGKPIRMRINMKRAKLYAFQFTKD